VPPVRSRRSSSRG